LEAHGRDVQMETFFQSPWSETVNSTASASRRRHTRQRIGRGIARVFDRISDSFPCNME